MTTSRRHMLKTMAIGTGAFLMAPEALMSAGRKKDKLGVALIGLGYYSTDLLAPALQQTKHCYLAGVVTGSPEKAEAWKRKYNLPDRNIYNYSNFDNIANNDDIDVVYVVLPPSMHKEYTVRGAKAGKHIWCEKPMAVTAQECEEMIAACKSNKRSLSIGYRLHHEPFTQQYRKLIRDKALGKITSVDCAAGYTEGRTDHWKQKKEMGGGALYDMGVYAIQGARLGSGMEPIAVFEGKTSTKRPDVYRNGLDETAEARLEFPGGVIANIKTSFGENVNFLHVRGDKAEMQLGPYSGYAGLSGTTPSGKLSTDYDVPFQQATQMDDDALAIMQKKPVLVPGEEGWRDIRIVEAIYRSAASGGSRVTL